MIDTDVKRFSRECQPPLDGELQRLQISHGAFVVSRTHVGTWLAERWLGSYM